MGEDENIKESDENPKEEDDIGEGSVEEKEEKEAAKVLIRTVVTVRYKAGKEAITIPADTLVKCSEIIADEWVKEKMAVYFDEKKLEVMEL